MRSKILFEISRLEDILEALFPAWNVLGNIDRMKRIVKRIRLLVNALDDNSMGNATEAFLKQQEIEAIKHSVVDIVGGYVEGRPTNTTNYLQRLRELVLIEKAMNAGK